MNRIEVEINGSIYPMIGEKSEDHMKNVAKYVDSKLQKIMSVNKGLSLSKASVLTAINVADELFECDEENSKLFKENEEIKSKLNEPNKEVETQINTLQYELKKSKLKEKEHTDKVEALLKTIEEQELKIKELNEKTQEILDQTSNYKTEIENLTQEVEESKQSVESAASLSSHFQNESYELKLKCAQLESEIKELKNK